MKIFATEKYQKKAMSSVVVLGVNKNIISKRVERVGNVRIGGSSPPKHSIFLYYSKIAELCDEMEWKDFFEVMSKGSFWKGLKFDGTNLICKVKTQNKFFEMTCYNDMNIESDIEFDYPRYQECKKFITDNSSHFSKKEEISIPVGLTSNVIETAGVLEANVSKQRMYVGEFARRKCREFHLPDCTREALVSSIFLKLSNKSITTKMFKVNSDGTIEGIDSLTIDISGYKFTSLSTPVTRIKKKADETTEVIDSKLISFKCSRNLSISKRKEN